MCGSCAPHEQCHRAVGVDGEVDPVTGLGRVPAAQRRLDGGSVCEPVPSSAMRTLQWSRRNVRATTVPVSGPSSTSVIASGRTATVPAPPNPTSDAAAMTFHPRNSAANGVRRTAPHLVRRAHLLHAACVEDGDAVREPERLVLVVGDEEHRLPELAAQRADLADQSLAQVAVERAEGLVEHQQRRCRRERAGKGDALLLAARELVDRALLVAREPDERERLPRRLLRVASCSPVHPQAERDVAEDVAMGNSAWSWNMSPRSRRCAGTPARSVPSRRMRPDARGSSPATARSSVDFPEPLGPTTQTISASSTVRSRPSTATVSP